MTFFPFFSFSQTSLKNSFDQSNQIRDTLLLINSHDGDQTYNLNDKYHMENIFSTNNLIL